MSAVTVYGASDDLIEIEGDLTEEFTLIDDTDGDVLTFSCGTALRIKYDRDGMWRITRIAAGFANMNKTEATNADDDYTDRVTLTGDAVTWVHHGNTLHKIGGT